ncbi:MAG: ABC transporter ATP-binding protein [Anaerolineae bacterium]|nr:ABC transporter ATP-binding protein [Anaerolineae bacterium]
MKSNGKTPFALEVKNITRSLPLGGEPIHILRGISLQVPRGEWLALTGPSGSGKSTLLGIMAGIDTPDSGQVILDGVPITDMRERQLARIRNAQIGIVFQSFNLIPTLTAQENVEAPLYVSVDHRDAAGRARKMLVRVGLADRLRHRPHQLSGGQQQRVAIARALVTQPAVLLADEPTGNLDQQTGAQIMALFARLQQELGVTIIVATHDPQVAGCAGRVLHLVDGRLAPAPPEVRLRQPALEGGAS